MPIIENGILIKVYNSDIVNGTFKIPDDVTEIGEFAFSSEADEVYEENACVDLIALKIPDGVKKSMKVHFGNCQT